MISLTWKPSALHGTAMIFVMLQIVVWAFYTTLSSCEEKKVQIFELLGEKTMPIPASFHGLELSKLSRSQGREWISPASGHVISVPTVTSRGE